MLHTFQISSEQRIKAKLAGTAPEGTLPLLRTYKAIGTDAYCSLYEVNGGYIAVFSHLSKNNV